MLRFARRGDRGVQARKGGRSCQSQRRVRVCGTLPAFPCTFALLAQANVQEHEQDSASEPQRHEHNRQQLANALRYHRRADRVGQDERAGQARPRSPHTHRGGRGRRRTSPITGPQRRPSATAGVRSRPGPVGRGRVRHAAARGQWEPGRSRGPGTHQRARTQPAACAGVVTGQIAGLTLRAVFGCPSYVRRRRRRAETWRRVPGSSRWMILIG
jgi:hypothetical protein